MSDDRTHHAALGAAIRLALGAAALTACGGVVSREPGPSSEPTASAAAPPEAASAPGAAAPPSASAPSASAASDAAPHDAGGASTCAEALAAAFPEADASDWWSAGPFSTDPFLAACCASLAAGVDDAGAQSEATLARVRGSGCCHVEFPERWAACTPWGPPTPPAFHDVEGVA